MLQAETYDPDGEFVSYWLPELQSVPAEKQNFPGSSYIKPIVPLKYGSSNRSCSRKTREVTTSRRPAGGESKWKNLGGKRRF